MVPSRFAPSRLALALSLAIGTSVAFFAPPGSLHAQSQGDAAAGQNQLLQGLAAMLLETTEPQTRLDILRGLRAALQGRKSVPMPAGWEAVESKLGADPNGEIRLLTQTLSLTFASPRAYGALRTLAADASAETAARRTALEALLAARDSQLPPILRTLLHDSQVRGQALRGLAFFDAPETPDAILQVYPNLPPAERRDALNTLASRAPYASRLLAAVVQGTIPRAEITAELARQLQSLKSNEVAQTLAQVWGVIREASPDMQQGVEKVRQVYRRGGSTPGDAPRGRVVFNRICAQCHHLFDFGGAVGPDITGANRGDLDYLIQNIVYPNAVIPNEYRVSLVSTRDDRTLTGIVKSQDANGLVIQTANELLTLTKAEVAKVELSEISMMPEGLLSNLTETEIRDLLYYLTRPGQVPLPAGTP